MNVNHRSSVESCSDGVKTGEFRVFQEGSGGSLLTGQVASGIEVA